MKSEFRTRREKSSARTIAELENEHATNRFSYGTRNGVRMQTALAPEDLHRLMERTLLSPGLRTIHAERLAQRYLQQLAQVKRSVRQEQKDLHAANRRYGFIVDPRSLATHDRFRFVTVLQGLEVLNVPRTLRRVRAFKDQLRSVIEGCRGLWCLGAIDVEVVPLELMRQLTDPSDSEEEKFQVCESMEQRLSERDQGLPVYFLIRFHGIAVASRPADFDSLEWQLTQQWEHDPRQVQVKPLSEVFPGKPKPLEQNLADIAQHITKGRNARSNKESSLRYKLASASQHLETEDAWANRNGRKNNRLRQERTKEWLEDALALTRSELCCLAQVIDGMMGMSRDRTGYLVLAQSKRIHHTATDSRMPESGIAA